MRLRAIAFASTALGAAAAGTWTAGSAAADWIERRAEGRLAAAWAGADLDWAEARADGLVMRLTGEAPDETARFHAVEIARGALDLGRIEDGIEVTRLDLAEPPAVALELLRSGDEVSLIGLVPAGGARRAITEALGAAGIAGGVTDMLETADHPAPSGWEPALDFGLALLAELPRAKIRITPGEVEVAAIAESEAERAALARQLEARAPASVTLTLDLGAPRPVITPYAVAFRRAADGSGRLVACSAESEEDAAAILEAAHAAGATEADACAIGLGAPSADWIAAATQGIGAVAELGAGSFALNDLDALLIGAPDVDPMALAAAGAALDAQLPQPYTLATRGLAPRPEAADDEQAAFAPEFRAQLDADGQVRLAGPVADRSSQIALLGFAEAVFGHDRVAETVVLDPNLPEGWPRRILSGVEALSRLAEGELAVTAERVTVSGRSLVEEAEREVAGLLAGRSVGPAIVDIVYDAEAAAALEAAERPREEVCADAVEAILAEEMILFELGSARIDETSADVLAALRTALERCPGARFEVSGHTDARGSAELNQRLSEQRAEAVAAALSGLGVTLEPRGYGPDRPVADNETEEGRALNRRIEFARLDVPEENAREQAEADPDESARTEADPGASEPEAAQADDEPNQEQPADAEQPAEEQPAGAEQPAEEQPEEEPAEEEADLAAAEDDPEEDDGAQ